MTTNDDDANDTDNVDARGGATNTTNYGGTTTNPTTTTDDVAAIATSKANDLYNAIYILASCIVQPESSWPTATQQQIEDALTAYAGAIFALLL